MEILTGNSSSILSLALFALLLPPACGGTGGAGEATMEPTTDGSATTAATVTSEATTVQTTTAATTGETTSATSEPGTTAETTGGPTIEDDCAAYCDKAQACMVEPPDPGCASSCVAELGFDEGECLDATQAYLQCLAGSTCEELMGLSDPDLPWPCEALNAAFEALCFPGACGAAVGGDVQGTECSAEILCPDEPTRTMECDQNECVCSIDGMPTGETCPAMGVCETHEALLDKASDCCGFST